MPFPNPLPYSLPTVLPGPLDPYVPSADDSGGVPGSLRALTDHCASARALILSQYKESPRLLALLCSYVDRIQNLDETIAAIYEHALNLETAEGEQLDLLGRIVREARNGRPDYLYRNGIRVRILINRSQGRIPDLLAILSLFERTDLEAGSFIRIREPQPASMEIFVDRTAVNASYEVHTRVRQAKAAGVGVRTFVFPSALGGRTDALRMVRVADLGSATEPGLDYVGGAAPGGNMAHVLG